MNCKPVAMVLKACVPLSQGLVLITSGHLVATTTAGPQRELFSPQRCHDSFCWRERREEEKMIRGTCDGVCVCVCVCVSLLADAGGAKWCGL